MADHGSKLVEAATRTAARVGKVAGRALTLKVLAAASPILLLVLVLVISLILGVTLIAGISNSVQAQNAQCYTTGPRLSNGTNLSFPLTDGDFTLTSGFGPRWGTEHNGQDFGARIGTPIYAAADGIVTRAGPASGFGQWIVLDHEIEGRGTVSTVYGHMPSDGGVLVRQGDTVTAGQMIGKVGNNGQSTGPHLHFEVWQGGRFGGTPQDPMPWLKGDGSGNQTGNPLPAPQAPGSAPQPAPGDSGGDAGSASGAPSRQELLPQPPVGAQMEQQLTADRVANAETIIGVGKGMGIPPRGWVIALAISLQESNLVNLQGGDRDSLGLFQQRPSQGWGSREQITDPKYSAQKYYEAFQSMIMNNPAHSDWEQQPLWKVGAIVQRPAAEYEIEYAKWEALSVNIVRAHYGAAELSISGGNPGEGCVSGESDTRAAPAADGGMVVIPVALAAAGFRRRLPIAGIAAGHKQ